MSVSLRNQLQASLGTGFTIDRELGGGGMSRVFVARDESLGRDVVVKVLPQELAQSLSVERFTREIKLVAALQEPHIVPVLSAGQTAEGLPWYTMPFVKGDSLRVRLNAGRVPLIESIGILRDVARALAYAHANGVVHRDIKPENVLLSSGTAMVTDFGIAKALAASTTQAPGGTLTQVGTSIGTPAYMAPEQAAGDGATDHRADLYAWGVMAHELLAGQHPFADKTTPQALMVPSLMVLHACRAAGIQPIGFIASIAELGEVEQFTRVLEEARALGFRGAVLVHPKFLEATNACYTPTPEQVAQARELIAVFDAAQAEGLGAIKHEGRMIDKPVYQRALRLLHEADL